MQTGRARKSSLESLVIRALAEHGELAARELRAVIGERHRTCSVQAVYQCLRSMQDRGVVLKSERRYALKFLWLEEMLELAAAVKRHYARRVLEPIDRGVVRERTVTFSSLVEMDSFYVQLTLALLARPGGRAAAEWLPHPWFMLTQTESESLFKRAIERSGRKLYVILGGETPLDSKWAADRRSSVIHYGQAAGPFEASRARYFTVVDDFVVTCVIRRRVAERIDQLFSAGDTPSRLWREVAALASAQHRCQVTILRDSVKAEKLYCKFSEYFGVRL